MYPLAGAPQDSSFLNDARSSDAVLVVDDENGVRELMSRWLQAGGYSVVCASGADEALGVMQQSSPAVALCDIRMPGHDGLWLADRIRKQYPETAVIMATGVHDVGAAVASLRHGVLDYLTKPFGRDRLRDAVVRGLEWHRTAKDSRCWRERLEVEVEARRAHVADVIGAQPVDSDETLEALLSALAAGEHEGLAHATRVAAMAVSIAQALGLSEEETATIRRGALLHDLGKLVMPEAVLRKPAPLTRDEQALIRRHPQFGAELIAQVPYLAGAAAIVRSAQERPDGLGYPAGTGGEHLSVAAQIVAAADAYDTMTRPRVFRGPLTAADALLELDRCSGTQFDPHIIGVLKQLLAH